MRGSVAASHRQTPQHQASGATAPKAFRLKRPSTPCPIHVEALTIAIEALTDDQRKLRRTVGGLSDSVGYGLKNRAIARLPDLPANRYAVAGSGRLARRFVE